MLVLLAGWKFQLDQWDFYSFTPSLLHSFIPSFLFTSIYYFYPPCHWQPLHPVKLVSVFVIVILFCGATWHVFPFHYEKFQTYREVGRILQWTSTYLPLLTFTYLLLNHIISVSLSVHQSISFLCIFKVADVPPNASGCISLIRVL